MVLGAEVDAEVLAEVGSVDVHGPVDFLLEDVESVFELEAFQEFLDQVHAERGWIVEGVLRGYFLSLPRSGCSY